MTKQAANNDDTKKSKSAVPSVEKAFDILELLANVEDGLTMNEMVDVLGRTMGEIYRIVIYLTERGFLVQHPDTSKYALTLKLFELSHRHDPTARLIARAMPIMERIAKTTEQSCHLGVLNHNNVLVLASVPSPRPAGYAVRTGALFPVERTSSGHVILAFSAPHVQTGYLNSAGCADGTDLRFAAIRESGYEDTPSTMIAGVRNLCVPVFDNRGITAAITTGYISQIDTKASAEETLSILRTAALELSQSLGFGIAEAAEGASNP